MQIPREPIAIKQAVVRLAEIFHVSELTEDANLEFRTKDGRVWDAVFNIRLHLFEGHSFVLKWKRSGSLGLVASAIHELGTAQSSFPHKVIPLLAVPYMGEAAQERCALAQLSWLDLSGNASIIVPGIFYQNLGQSQPLPSSRAAGERVRTKGFSDDTTAAHGTLQGDKAAHPSLYHRSG